MRTRSTDPGREGCRVDSAIAAIPAPLARVASLGLIVAASVVLSGCGRRDEVRLVADLACPVYDDSTSQAPRLLYEDGTRTLNDRCMVRPARLNPKIRAIYVNGRPVGFC